VTWSPVVYRDLKRTSAGGGGAGLTAAAGFGGAGFAGAGFRVAGAGF